MQDHYEKKGDYNTLLELLHSKAERKDLDSRCLNEDPLYRSLKHYYEENNDYAGKKNLFNLHLQQNELDLKFFKEAESVLNPKDWEIFKPQWIDATQNKRDQLAEVYNYLDEKEALWKVVKKDQVLLKKYETKLLPLYTQDYLKLYQTIIDDCILARGRDNYKIAAQYAQTVKNIYVKILKQPSLWHSYITQILQSNKILRGLQEEFRNL